MADGPEETPSPILVERRIIKGESLVESLVMGVPAHWYPACKIVWFSYGN
jgi:hypothetical protein